MKSLQIQNKVVPLHSQSGNNESTFKKTGALVQLVRILVRIHACHAWGHGFESRTHRQFTKQN